MAVRQILKIPHPILAAISAPVSCIDSALKSLIEDMFDTMYAAPGVGLAAPQIGVSQRLAVIDPSAKGEPNQPFVLINPEIYHQEGREMMKEGCLSIPGIYEIIPRATRISLKTMTVDGEWITMEAEGFLAEVIQHEVDHLNGILYIDHLSSLRRRRAFQAFKQQKRKT